MDQITPPRRPARRPIRGLPLIAAVAAVLGLALGPLTAPAPARALTWSAPLCTEFAGCNAAGLPNAGYQGVYTTSHWYMYGGHNCTNYVAYRLQQDGIARFVRTGHGNAWEWGSEARLAGLKVDRGTPRPGDVAWWDVKAIGGLGHVAYVESVDAAAGTFTVSEDNYSSTFDWRTYRISEVSGFIRVAKKQIAAPAKVAIGGTARIGQTLTASPGTWIPADVTLRYQWLRDGAFIRGATGRTYAVSDADGGRSISVQVTAGRSGYNTTSRLSAAVAVPAQPLRSVQTPSITGVPEVGATLTAVRGTWQPAGISYAYAWLRDGTPIPGARAKTYALTAADAGHRIAVRVTGSKAGYTSATRTSAALAIPLQRFTTTHVPSVSGEPRVGAALTAIRGSWAPAGIAYGYQWLRDGAPIAGARSKTYVPTTADAGRSVSVEVTGSKNGYETTTRRSPGVAVPLLSLTRAQVPAIDGTPAVGATLTAVRGTWSPAGVSYRYQWLRDGAPIAGATGKTYTLAAADAGHAIAVRVTGAKTGYAPVAHTSPKVAVPLRPLTRTYTPRVDGEPRVGRVLTAIRGTWSPSGLSYRYQWLRAGTPIAGATGKTYTPTSADRGARLSVRVTAARTGYVTTSRTSAATPAVTR